MVPAETPLPRKDGIRAGQRVAFLDAPPEFATALGELVRRADLAGDTAKQAVDQHVAATSSRAGYCLSMTI